MSLLFHMLKVILKKFTGSAKRGEWSIKTVFFFTTHSDPAESWLCDLGQEDPLWGLFPCLKYGRVKWKVLTGALNSGSPPPISQNEKEQLNSICFPQRKSKQNANDPGFPSPSTHPRSHTVSAWAVTQLARWDPSLSYTLPQNGCCHKCQSTGHGF